MSVAEHCRKALTVSAEDTVRSAAQRMEKEGIGCLIVVRQDRPLGVLTDRDVALRVLGQKLDPGAVKVGEIMQQPLVSIAADAPLAEAMQTMRLQGLRRLPVVDKAGALAGVITLDDLLRRLATELSDLAEAVRAQLANEPVQAKPRTAPGGV